MENENTLKEMGNMKGDRRYELGDGKLVPSEISGNENDLEVCSLFVCSFLTFFFRKQKR